RYLLTGRFVSIDSRATLRSVALNGFLAEPQEIRLPVLAATDWTRYPVPIDAICCPHDIPIEDPAAALRTCMHIAPSRVFDDTVAARRPIQPVNRRLNRLFDPPQCVPELLGIAIRRVVPSNVNSGGRQIGQQGAPSCHQRRDPGHARSAERVEYQIAWLSKFSDERENGLRWNLGVVAMSSVGR